MVFNFLRPAKAISFFGSQNTKSESWEKTLAFSTSFKIV